MTRPRGAAALWAAVCGAVAVVVASPWIVPSTEIQASGPMSTYGRAASDRVVASVHAVYDSTGRSAVTVHLSGLRPHEPYLAFAYEQTCTALQGRRYQSFPDPEQPSSDPDYVNPQNELWFTGTADARGEGTSTVRRDDQFAEDHRPGSVVLEGPPTVLRDGTQLPGARLACLTVSF